jgi:hypothetical protein
LCYNPEISLSWIALEPDLSAGSALEHQELRRLLEMQVQNGPVTDLHIIH